jgi:eukaryotic-like serine/threonine-protein kinase
LISKYFIDVSIDVATGLESAARGSKAYSLSWKTQLTKAQRAGLPFHERAVALDPNFAVAYSAMAWIYWSDAAENARKAYDLLEKVSDRERFWIEGYYYLLGNWRLGEGRADLRVVETAYPRDFVPLNWLGLVFFR